MSNYNELLAQVQWDDNGLAPCIAQCTNSKRILMMAWMNADSLRATLETKQVTYWSRSRQKLWRKGESSGHVQTLEKLQIDCDGDCLIAFVEQHGGIACHTGTESCFFREQQGENWTVIETPIKDAKDIYS